MNFNNESYITVTSLKLYSRIIDETGEEPVQILRNFKNPKYYVWKFVRTPEVEKIINDYVSEVENI